jgi:hypothetical protein
MIVLICGDRLAKGKDLVQKALDKFGIVPTEVISGGAEGADKLAEEWANANDVPFREFAADWNDIHAEGAVIKINQWKKKYNVNAGFKRNSDMVEEADIVIALQPNGPTAGTMDTIKKGKKKGIPVHIYEKEASEYKYTF